MTADWGVLWDKLVFLVGCNKANHPLPNYTQYVLLVDIFLLVVSTFFSIHSSN
jgi:hypothetical protein